MENQESLQASALVRKLADAVKHQIDDFLADSVVATSVVVGGIFLSGDELLGVEQGAVRTSADFINDSWLQVDKDSTGNVFARASFREESVERVITTTNRFVRGHLTIGLYTMFKAVEFPASVTNLNTSLTNMDGDTLTHFDVLGMSLRKGIN